MTQSQEHLAFIDGKLEEWKNHLLTFALPTWDDIPDIGLYMDQVITQLDTYLDYLAPDIKGDPLATKAMINNYVRTRLIPAPEKKRYYRRHIAYLIIVNFLKQSMSISQISHGLPRDLSDSEIHQVYDRFVAMHKNSSRYFCREVEKAVAVLRGEQSDHVLGIKSVDDLILASAIIGGYGVLMANKIEEANASFAEI